MSKRPPSPPTPCSAAKARKKNATYAEIQHASNKCWTALLVCQNCKQVPNSFSFSEDNNWLMDLYCGKCYQSFKVCTLCRSNKYQLFNDADIKRHARLNSHKKNATRYQSKIEEKNKLEEETVQFNLDSTSFTSSNETDPEKQILSQHLSNPKMKYFLMENYSLGNAYLYASSFFPLHGNIYEQVTNYDAEFSLRLGEFAFGLTKSLLEKFTNILNGLRGYMLQDSSYDEDSTSSPFPLKLPLTIRAMRTTFFETNSCLRTNLPIPNVTVVTTEDSKYSFTPLLECLAHFLAFGQGTEDVGSSYMEEFKKNTPVTSTKESRAANERKKEASDLIQEKNNQHDYFVTFLNTFSDAFDPTVSLVRSNKHGVWVHQVSFLKSVDGDELASTYILSLQSKSNEHETELMAIEEEISRYRSGDCPMLYHGGLRKMVKPLIFPLLHHADQPERREIFGTKLGQGTNHARCRYSFNFKAIHQLLPSCPQCKPIIDDYCRGISSLVPKKCESCTNWEFLDREDILKWAPHESFPTDMIPPSGYLHPMELTKSCLRAAAEISHHHLSECKWNRSNTQEFLSHHCISTRLSDAIIDNALNVRLLRELENEKDNTVYDVLVKDKLKNPEKYKLTRLPTSWNSTQEMCSYPDAPMHLYSGTVKAVMKLSFRALKRDNKLDSYLRLLKRSKQMEEIDVMNVPWFPLMKITNEKFPGMGSENQIAVGRYLKLMGLCLKNLVTTPPMIFPPDSTQKNWNKKFNFEWLKIRDLDTQGDANTLRNRVEVYMTSSDCPPIKKSTSVSIESLQRMYASTYNALSHLMSGSTCDKHAERSYIYVKKLLNDIEAVDRILRTEYEKPVWTTKYNLICLLNCKEDMVRYGPSRRRWEGDGGGEKNIQGIKSAFKGFNTNWEKNTHTNYYMSKTMNKLERNTTDSKIKVSDKLLSEKSVLHVYTSAEEASSTFLLGKPLMIVCLTNSEFGVLHSGSKFWKLTDLKFKHVLSYVCLFEFKLSSKTNIDIEINESMIQNVCIAIPFEGLFVILDMEWRELDSDLQFKYGYK